MPELFDKHGGFYFTDLGKGYGRLHDRGAGFYAKPDGAIFPYETVDRLHDALQNINLSEGQTMQVFHRWAELVVA